MLVIPGSRSLDIQAFAFSAPTWRALRLKELINKNVDNKFVDF